ncbi:MAG: peptidyl-prolyl cis-trans isomerase [Acidobacteria bacterium]|jgi:parvulin-like peptidyl-prolyl isomerase|nr:peptidyl-prolyl cis-trans isomerase [Acidobacteriota bacterium]
MSWPLLLAALAVAQAETPPLPPPPPAGQEQPAAPEASPDATDAKPDAKKEEEPPPEVLRGTTVGGTRLPTQPSGSAAPAPPGSPGAAPGSPTGPASGPRAEELRVEEIVAWVNDDVVLLSELRTTEQQALSAMMKGKRVSSGEMSAKVAEVQNQMLMSLISNRLLVQEAERLYDVNEIGKDLIKRWRERNDVKSDEQFDRILKDELHMSRADLQDKLISGAAPDYVIDTQVTRSISVSDKEARQYYDEHRAEFLTPGQVTFREIVLLAESNEQKRARMDEAVDLVEQAKRGADFAKLVEAESEGPSKSLGGLIGPVAPSDLAESVAEAIVKTPAGQVVGPIPTPVGWQIVKIEQKLDEKITPFEQARARCEEAVRQEKFPVVYEKFMTGLWEAATVEVRKDYQSRMPKNMQAKVVFR